VVKRINALNKFLVDIGYSPISLTRLELIRDIADIAIVAFALYFITKWIKETRAWTLFKGILLIVIIFFVSTLLELRTIGWIISNTLNLGILALLIIFQPELRKALEELGKGKIVSTITPATYIEPESATGLTQKNIAEIVGACVLLSKAKTGALIVVGQQVGLMDLILTGINIDAAVSKQLIINIFEDKTPLHDGAVIITNNRLTAASCIMPLTSTELGSQNSLGTRHRAAVGASEISDAIVIVVSEETGIISVAKDGRLKRNLDDKDLFALLSGDSAKGARGKAGQLLKGRGKKDGR
jgi:diadenylate cyclase